MFRDRNDQIEKSRDPNSSDRKVLFRKFRVQWQTLTQVNITLFSQSNIVSTKSVQGPNYHAVCVQVNPPNLQHQFQSRNVSFVLNPALETLIKYQFSTTSFTNVFAFKPEVPNLFRISYYLGISYCKCVPLLREQLIWSNLSLFRRIMYIKIKTKDHNWI